MPAALTDTSVPCAMECLTYKPEGCVQDNKRHELKNKKQKNTQIKIKRPLFSYETQNKGAVGMWPTTLVCSALQDYGIFKGLKTSKG